MDRKRIVHTLDTPYSAVEWPQISQDDQDAILELLCQLLSPIGTHRRSFVTPSKGKRKRRRTEKTQNPETALPAASPAPVPAAPELAAYVDVGLSQISRALQTMSGKDAITMPSAPAEAAPAPGKTDSRPYSIVFVARSGQSSAFNSHFPQMVALAVQSQSQSQTQTQSQPQPQSLSADQTIRLVGFSKACEDRLSAALGIPRVSSIGLREGAPLVKGLIDFVRERVAPVEVPWLREARSGTFLETKIAAVPTKVGNKKARLG